MRELSDFSEKVNPGEFLNETGGRWLFSFKLYVAVYVTGPLKPSLMYEKNSKRE